MVAAGKAASAPGEAKFLGAVPEQGRRTAGSTRGATEAGGGREAFAAHRISRPAQGAEPQETNRK